MSAKLGKRIADLRAEKSHLNGQIYYHVHTGILDYLGDEIILSVYPDRRIVTDEGYTETVLSGESGKLNISNAKILIDSHGVILRNTFEEELEVKYEGEHWEAAVSKLTACIVDVYSILTYK